jgi:hypothetical protein
MVITNKIGAIFMAKNASPGVRIRRIFTMYHFVKEHVEDGVITFVFVKKTTLIQTLSSRISTRIPTRDIW